MFSSSELDIVVVRLFYEDNLEYILHIYMYEKLSLSSVFLIINSFFLCIFAAFSGDYYFFLTLLETT